MKTQPQTLPKRFVFPIPFGGQREEKKRFTRECEDISNQEKQFEQ